MKKVFISRHLQKESLFHYLPKDQFQVTGISLLKIETLQLTKLPKADWYFFYSKNGIRHFKKNLLQLNQSLPANIKYACLGGQTAKFLEQETGISPDFAGSGNPQESAHDFLKVYRSEEKVTFFTAADSVNSIMQILSGKILSSRVSVYNNTIRGGIKLEPQDYILLTSPKNSEAYFAANHYLPVSQEVICIGQTTALHVHNMGVKELIISPQPSEEAMYQTLLRIC